MGAVFCWLADGGRLSGEGITKAWSAFRGKAGQWHAGARTHTRPHSALKASFSSGLFRVHSDVHPQTKHSLFGLPNKVLPPMSSWTPRSLGPFDGGGLDLTWGFRGMEETSNKNFPSPDLFDLDAGGWGYAWTSPLSGHWLLVFSRTETRVDNCCLHSLWRCPSHSPLCRTFLLLNLNFICGKSLAANASLQTTLSNSCFSKYFWLWSPFFLSPFFFFTSFIQGGQPLYMASVFPLSAPEPTADIANGHHIPFFYTLIQP